MDKINEQNLDLVSSNSLTVVLVYCGQIKKMVYFIDNMLDLYDGKYNIMYNIVSTNLDTQIYNYLVLKKIKFKLFNKINEAIFHSDNEIVIFQDITTIHKNSNILETVFSEIKHTDILCMTKKISNEKMVTDFKNLIYQNKLSDIICLKNSKYKINSEFTFDMNYMRNNTNYKFIITEDVEYLFPSKIPKKLHFYWDKSNISYLTNLTIKTFIYNNPDWEINLWSPNIPHIDKNLGETNDFILPSYNDYNYLDYEYLKSLGVNINSLDYFDLKLKKNISEITKSDIFRWKILSTIGGVWSDLDILFIDKIEKTSFEQYDCGFNDLDTVVSQCSKILTESNTQIDFYYIGFLMSSPNNEFFKIMYDKSVNNIITGSNEGVGGDLMIKQFGLYNNIKNIIPTINYCNLNPKSIYYYWWGDIKEMYANNSQPDIYDFMLHNNYIIGYYYFNGIYLSRIYTLFLNYEKKIQNYNFNGPVPKWINYYKTLFNDFQLNTYQKKISIVMGYVDRKDQLYLTLNTILKSQHKNYEVIIVNDENVDINFVKEDFPTINIKIIDNFDKKHTNPCMTYNLGVEHSTGEILLLQNPECCHIGDILTVVNAVLKQNDYLAFSTFYLDNFSKNKEVSDIILNNDCEYFWSVEKIHKLLQYTLENISKRQNPVLRGWVSHPVYNKNFLHFCSAIYKSDFERIGGFTEEYKDGICFDDDDFVRKIKCNNLNTQYFRLPDFPNSSVNHIEHSVFVFHQHHNHFSYDDKNIKLKWQKNKVLFLESNIKHIQKYLKTKYLDNHITNYYNLHTKNISIISYDNNYYNIDVHELDNFIEILPTTENEKKIENIFNGRRSRITNNLSEILNNSIFKVLVTIDLENVQQHITFQGKFKNKFKVIIDTIGKARIKLEYHLIHLYNIDNTILSDI